MSYAKLFNSILASTVWQAPDHVRIVWITMLAMKDRDGVVEASIPGLAHQARVSVPQCEEAIALFLAPDPYSRTPDHEGRRIEPVDGGWRLLNADKYREKLDEDDQRAKANRRMQRLRQRRRGDVTGDAGDAGDVTVRHADTDTDQIHSESPDPDREGGGDLDPPSRLPPEPKTRTLAGPGGPGSRPDPDLTATLARSSEHIRDVGEAVKVVWGELQRARADIAAELGLEVWPLVIDDPGQRDLARRLRDAPGVEMGVKQARHVLALAVEEARAKKSVEWLTGSVFSDGSWRYKLARQPGDMKREAAKKRGDDVEPKVLRVKPPRGEDDMPPLLREDEPSKASGT